MRRILIVGTTLAATKAQQDALIAQLQKRVPDREVLIIPGCLWVSEHEVNEVVEAPRPDPLTPDRASRKKAATQAKS